MYGKLKKQGMVAIGLIMKLLYNLANMQNTTAATSKLACSQHAGLASHAQLKFKTSMNECLMYQQDITVHQAPRCQSAALLQPLYIDT
jgi:hypothetical protein